MVKKRVVSFNLPLKLIEELRAYANENKMTRSDAVEQLLSLALQISEEAQGEILDDVCPALVKIKFINSETYYCTYNLPKGSLKKIPAPTICEACKVVQSLKEAQKQMRVERPKTYIRIRKPKRYLREYLGDEGDWLDEI